MHEVCRKEPGTLSLEIHNSKWALNNRKFYSLFSFNLRQIKSSMKKVKLCVVSLNDFFFCTLYKNKLQCGGYGIHWKDYQSVRKRCGKQQWFPCRGEMRRNCVFVHWGRGWKRAGMTVIRDALTQRPFLLRGFLKGLSAGPGWKQAKVQRPKGLWYPNSGQQPFCFHWPVAWAVLLIIYEVKKESSKPLSISTQGG